MNSLQPQKMRYEKKQESMADKTGEAVNRNFARKSLDTGFTRQKF